MIFVDLKMDKREPTRKREKPPVEFGLARSRGFSLVKKGGWEILRIFGRMGNKSGCGVLGSCVRIFNQMSRLSGEREYVCVYTYKYTHLFACAHMWYTCV